MIRWRFILVRAAIVVAVVMMLRWGLGPVARYATTWAIETVTGAKVDIQHTQVGLFPPRIRYSGVQIADPREGKSMRDAFRAETIDLVIDGQAWLHRRWVVRSGRMTGLQIGSRRDTSGHLPSNHSDADRNAHGPSTLRRLLTTTTDSLNEQASDLIDDLETVRRSQEIRASWEAEHASLVQQARELEKEIREIRDQARGIENPLRDWTELEKTLAKARRARSELLQVRRSIDTMPARLQDDLKSLQEAKQTDLARVDQYVPVDLTQSGNFGLELLTASVREQLRKTRSYMENGRQLADYTVVAPGTQRQRGVDHDLVGPNRQPNVMLRHCEINGLMRAGGHTYDLTGILNHLTPTPQWSAEPTRARLRLEGPEVIRVDYTRDRRQGLDSDRLTLHWPKTEAKPMRLGGDDAGISIAGGRRELWVQIHSQGEQLQGRLVSKRTGLKMELRSNPDYADSPAAVSLRDSLASIDHIEIDARFDGTWKDFALRLDTNLGTALSQAARDAVADQVRASKQRLTAKIEQTHHQQTVKLRNWLETQQNEARSLLASADESIEEMSQEVIREVGGSEAYLGSLRSAIQTRLR